MIHLFIQVAVGVAVALTGVFIGDRLVEATTGKSIRKHLVQWWNEVYADIQLWLHGHQHLKIARVAAVAASIVDQGVLAVNQLVRIIFQAELSQGEPRVISERTLTAREAIELFPQFRHALRVELPLEM